MDKFKEFCRDKFKEFYRENKAIIDTFIADAALIILLFGCAVLFVLGAK